jgi:CRISPR-associated protein Cas6
MKEWVMVLTENKPNVQELLNMSYVELSFGVIGETLPADHGYGLYSAIAHRCPEIHELDGVSIQTIPGKPDEKGKISLHRQSRFRVRLPYDSQIISLFLPLAGQQLKIGNHEIQLGIPQIAPIQPATTLRSRLVTIKKFQEPKPFLEAVQRQLATLEIEATAEIPPNRKGELDRKTIKIKTYSVVGFGVYITDLNEQDSMKLQIYGLGGKHRMGCGIFNSFSQRERLIYE